MEINKLIKTTDTKKRRLGRGHGSGRGKTAGRGTKGQNARSRRPLSFEGGALPLIKRLPFLRGKGKNKGFMKKPVVVNLESLRTFKKDSIISTQSLVKSGIITIEQSASGVKILSSGVINVALDVRVPVSKKAAEKITKAGGKIKQNG